MTDYQVFEDAMNLILPPKAADGKIYKSGITTSDGERQDFYASRRNGSHGAVDMNYRHNSGAPVGQSGLNLKHPEVRSPVAGTVINEPEKDRFGRVIIHDKKGYLHELWHLDDVRVRKDYKVIPGHVLGTMGGRGPGGSAQFDQHVHYSLKRPDGKAIDPEKHWNDSYVNSRFSLTGTKTVDSSRAETLDPAAQQEIQNRYPGVIRPSRPAPISVGSRFPMIAALSGETLRREGDKVYRIEQDGSTRGYFVSE